MPSPTRRQALATLAAAPAFAAAKEDYEPQALSIEEFRRLDALVETILPTTDTPGASEAGVAVLIDEDAADDPEFLQRVQLALDAFAGFEDLDSAGRIERLQAAADSDDEQVEIFLFLKGLTIERYYATEIGLVEELGWQGNTYLAEFPGCVHDHLIEEEA